MKWISSSLMLWQTTQILVAGIHLIGLIGKDETPVTGAKSNTTKPRRESCKSDKIASLVCGPESPQLHFSPFMIFIHRVFWAWTRLFEHFVPLLPCINTLLVNLIVCHNSILSFKFKGKERENLLRGHSLSCILNNNTKSLSYFVQCIKSAPSIQCSWST